MQTTHSILGLFMLLNSEPMEPDRLVCSGNPKDAPAITLTQVHLSLITWKFDFWPSYADIPKLSTLGLFLLPNSKSVKRDRFVYFANLNDVPVVTLGHRPPNHQRRWCTSISM